VFNTPEEHNLIVCTLCSCYPWPVLGLPPVWYKSPPYRSKAVIDPRGTLADFGVTLPEGQRIRVWDSTAETRFLVIPMRPDRHRGLVRGELATIVSRDSMIGTGLVTAEAVMNGGQDLGGQMGFGPVVPSRTSRSSTATGKSACWRSTLPPARWGNGASTKAGMPAKAFLRPITCPSSYYEIWLAGSRTCSAARFPHARRTRARASRLLLPRTPKRVLKGEDVATVLRRGFPYEREAQAPAKFSVGDTVRTIVMHPHHHTRLPRYARGKLGTIERVSGCHVFPDTGAQGCRRRRNGSTPLSSPVPSSGAARPIRPRRVSIEAWESYLEPA
jgi:hypothetical protein